MNDDLKNNNNYNKKLYNNNKNITIYDYCKFYLDFR